MSKITILEHLRLCSEAAKKFAGGLYSELAGTVANALDEMENVKADKPSVVSVTIPTSGWSSDSDANYPKYYDISASGITTKDRAEITIAPASLSTVKSCGLCPTTETLAGKIRIRSVSTPATAIKAEYLVEKGKG